MFSHFVILYTLGIPDVETDDEEVAYFITWPLLAILAALLAVLQFYWLKLSELLPLDRITAGFFATVDSPVPRFTTIAFNAFIMILVTTVTTALYEWLVTSSPLWAIGIAIGLPLVGYIILWAVSGWFLRDLAIFCTVCDITRAILPIALTHVVLNAVVSLTAYFTESYNATWIAALLALIILLLITGIVGYLFRDSWCTPPRGVCIVASDDICLPPVSQPLCPQNILPPSGACPYVPRAPPPQPIVVSTPPPCPVAYPISEHFGSRFFVTQPGSAVVHQNNPSLSRRTPTGTSRDLLSGVITQ